MSATNQKNIFIDTEQYHGSDNSVKLLFPSQTLVVPQGFGMKLSLQQFTMKKSFYNINDNNNKFYLYDSVTQGYTEIEITKGNYYKMGNSDTDAGSLLLAIKLALQSKSISSTITYFDNTQKIHLSTAFPSTKYFVFFQIPPQRQTTLPANVTASGYFSDSAEIFGAISNQEEPTGDPIEGFARVPNEYISQYPASLFSMENLRILVNLGSTNLETPNMDANSSTSICLTSQTFATIPLQTGTFDGNNLIEPALIYFQDDGDELFSIKLQQSHIDTATFSLVDSKGRPLNEVASNQYKNGMLSYQMVLRWEIIEEPFVANPTNMPSQNRTGNLLPKLK